MVCGWIKCERRGCRPFCCSGGWGRFFVSGLVAGLADWPLVAGLNASCPLSSAGIFQITSPVCPSTFRKRN
jgi:hypothetical protein